MRCMKEFDMKIFQKVREEIYAYNTQINFLLFNIYIYILFNFTVFLEYKNDKNQLISIELQRPINIADIPNNIAELIMKNNELFMNFGLKLTCDKTTNTILIIRTIPKCFRRKKNNSIILTSLIRQLLMEIINRLINGIGLNNLPLTIHNAIASEACHGI